MNDSPLLKLFRQLWGFLDWTYAAIFLAFLLISILPILNDVHPKLFDLGKRGGKRKRWIYFVLISLSGLIVFFDKLNMDMGVSSFQSRVDSNLIHTSTTTQKIDKTTNTVFSKVKRIDTAVNRTFISVDGFYHYTKIFNDSLSKEMTKASNLLAAVKGQIERSEKQLDTTTAYVDSINLKAKIARDSINKIIAKLEYSAGDLQKTFDAITTVIQPQFPCKLSVSLRIPLDTLDEEVLLEYLREVKFKIIIMSQNKEFTFRENSLIFNNTKQRFIFRKGHPQVVHKLPKRQKKTKRIGEQFCLVRRLN